MTERHDTAPPPVSALDEALAKFAAKKTSAAPVVRAIRAAMKHGCGDNSCEFRKPTGMATNGGCRCWGTVEHALYMLRPQPLGDADRRETPPQDFTAGMDLSATDGPPVYGSDVLCAKCAVVFCPHGERLHFDKDGCPWCASPQADTPAETRPECSVCAGCDGLTGQPASVCDEHYRRAVQGEADEQNRNALLEARLSSLTTQIEALVKWAHELDAATGQAFEELRDDLASIAVKEHTNG